ncbi:MAG: thiamine diphosphokinase [Ignavibacteria bacterium]|nr:thiamine diphosphokinase [Ignavibacteria bacterium]
MPKVKLQTDNIKECLIVSHGKLVKSDLNYILKFIKPRKALFIIACDGASEFLKASSITPDVIIGDLDSIKPAVLKYFSRKNVVIKKVYDQNKNDLEKAIIYALSKKFKHINIIGFGGKRLDHTLNNLSILKKFYLKADIRIFDNGFEGKIINRIVEIDCRIGDTVSLIPLPEAAGITTSGLKYPLKNGSLEIGIREGALNEAVAEKVSVEIKSGVLLVLNKST